MPFYHKLKHPSAENKRCLTKLIELRAQLKAEVPEKTQSKHLLFATWNIRDFDKPSYNSRLKESFYYIAEIISHFDIVAIQEVYKDLNALNKVMEILGSGWDYIFTDTTEGGRGNSERMAYVFDKSKVRFGGLCGEMVIPPMSDGTPVGQVWRTPMISGFEAGWARFMMCSVHIQWGSNDANSAERIKEIEHVAKFLERRSKDETAWARKLILLGDFNIFSQKHQTYAELEKRGFKSPKELTETYTNLGKEKRTYDQILLKERKERFEVVKGGAFDFTKALFTLADEPVYKPLMLKKKKKETDPDEFYSNYKQWSTHQMSDHLPLWLEVKIDYSDAYLSDLLKKQELPIV